MISLASVSANIKVIGRGGGRKKLHSHTMAFINAPGPAITYLPRSIEKEDLQVVFSNATAKDMDFAKKKFVRVRRNQIDQMAAFVKENNPAYARATRLQTDIDSLEEDSILVDHCAEDNRDLITEVINDASRVNTDAHAPKLRNSNRIGCCCPLWCSHCGADNIRHIDINTKCFGSFEENENVVSACMLP